LVRGKKVAGILIEGEGAAVVTGIGVNCVSHPTETAYPATNLKEMGVAITSDNLLAALSDAMESRLAEWDRGNGFTLVRREWLARASGVGDPIRVRVGDRNLVGRFEELDAMGHLRLSLPGGGVETIAAGDVFPLATMSAM
jgi:BirA family biotin operon repressor/biotin-[acetyl-CoA-carboxylase] ligase